MTNWEKEIGAMTLFVPDLDRAREFYQQVFGLDAQPMDDDTVMLRFKDMAVFLHRADAAQQPLPEVLDEARKGAGQFAIIVDDVDAVWSELAAREVEVLSGPADRPWGMRTVTLADPGGHIWEIAQQIPGDPAP
ncbi:MAG TPA: VOC family protein [Streptosporangiaceae bacterium]|nr:VOC family protein [Streptosporangiaceae bacterium]